MPSTPYRTFTINPRWLVTSPTFRITGILPDATDCGSRTVTFMAPATDPGAAPAKVISVAATPPIDTLTRLKPSACCMKRTQDSREQKHIQPSCKSSVLDLATRPPPGNSTPFLRLCSVADAYFTVISPALLGFPLIVTNAG